MSEQWFGAKLLYVAKDVKTGYIGQCEESVILIKANNLQEAEQKAIKYGQKHENGEICLEPDDEIRAVTGSHPDPMAKECFWYFDCVLDVYMMDDDEEPAEYVEVFSTMHAPEEVETLKNMYWNEFNEGKKGSML